MLWLVIQNHYITTSLKWITCVKKWRAKGWKEWETTTQEEANTSWALLCSVLVRLLPEHSAHLAALASLSTLARNETEREKERERKKKEGTHFILAEMHPKQA